MIEIYTDGSCTDKCGGWGAIIRNDQNIVEMTGGDVDTTNNRMELMGPIISLESLQEPTNIKIYTDSQYVVKGITTWIINWKLRNWKNIKNVDLWKRLDFVCGAHNITWIWIKGHNGHPWNERADRLAGSAQGQLTVKTKTVSI